MVHNQPGRDTTDSTTEMWLDLVTSCTAEDFIAFEKWLLANPQNNQSILSAWASLAKRR